MSKKIDWGITQGRDYIPGSQGEPVATPRPWSRWVRDGKRILIHGRSIHDGWIADCGEDFGAEGTNAQNADLIIKAVNNHDSLVGAIHEAIFVLNGNESVNVAIDVLEKALNQVKGVK